MLNMLNMLTCTHHARMSALDILGAVQFIAITSNMCAVQGATKFAGYFSMVLEF